MPYRDGSGQEPGPAIANRGYRLSQPLDLIMPHVIAGYLKTSFMGRTIMHAPATESTNEDAKDLARGYRGGTVFIAETQSGGKGRIGRHWSSPPGGIWMSVLLRPQILPAKVPGLVLVAGYAVVTAIRETLNLNARLKWPNDILVEGRKVCGILCEMRAELDCVTDVVAGIGINANLRQEDLPPEVRDTAASLKVLLGRVVDRNKLIAEVLNRLETHYSTFMVSGLRQLSQGIGAVSAFTGETVTLSNLTASDQAETTGTFMGIDAEGQAVLQVPGGESRAFSAGDLSLRKAKAER